MTKQLYTPKIGSTIKITLLATASMLLAACGDAADDNQAAADIAQETQQAAQSAPAETAQVADTTPAETVSAEEAGFLNHDMVMGDPNAPIEIIEYASLTCNHCATFHNNVLPRIKEKYVDTGKVKIVFRSYMLNAIDMTASSISRCLPERRYFPFMNMLFERQMQWYDVAKYQELSANNDQETANRLFVESVMGEIEKYARQAGLNKAKIDACLANEEVGKYLFEVQQHAVQHYKVNATPTIIINENKVGNDYASIERAIEAALN
ncbi:thioredoxin domain-containing protein [Pseudemcibacter aquimaris]|uniref:thioredoxin domain-containing protein n=1 Tax=Pseudemcibacter aquimaris TaxID=2857064 RepID=UPI002011785F|nr:thioredoxin domain-containing protein [Pseudemcibacter aquimaris]MCC3862453.1 DsbA family protein [Pseudemcibacter aquimaris]WDU59119.1 DsbA family protein [Pseudemcibacter aquimaris]